MAELSQEACGTRFSGKYLRKTITYFVAYHYIFQHGRAESSIIEACRMLWK